MYKDWKIAELPGIPKNGLKVFSCFSCGGGSSMGYKLAGYEVAGVNEIDPELTAMYTKNFPLVKIVNMPIQDMVKKKAYPPEAYGIDILDGSPPCSSFSMAGNREKDWGKDKVFREGQAKQVLDDLFFWFIQAARDLKPKVVIAENVKGMVAGKAKGYVSKIFREFDLAGYNTQLFLLNSASMGVPQKRERVFFIATSKEHFPDRPKLTLSFNETPVFFKDIKTEEGFIKPVTELEAKLLASSRPSDRSLADVNMRLRGKNIGFTMNIIRDDQVAPTTASGGAAYSFSAKRHLSTAELVRIQSFPQDYDFMRNGDYSHVKYVLGMSVPPIMMKGVAEQVAKQLFKK